MNLRILKILLVFSVAAWGIFNGIGNLMFYDEWVKIVGYVMLVENTQYNGEPSSRAITFPIFYVIAYAFIYLSKFATGIFCGWGAVDLWKVRSASAGTFNNAKSRFYFGCGVTFFMLIFGFLVMAGSFFATGGAPSELSQGFHSFVTVYMVCIGFALLFVAIPEQEGN